MTLPDDESPGRALLVALGAMFAVAVVVGLAVGLAVSGVVSLSLDGSADGAEAEPTLVMPSLEETSPEEEPRESPTPSRKPKPPIELVLAPTSVGAGERIEISGSYPGGDGVDLQIQRREGDGWIDFPVTATVSDGRFATWIQTTRTGESAFRVYDGAADKASNVVVVTVG